MIVSTTKKTYLNNFLVGHTSKEYILLILVRVEANNVGDFPIAKTLQTLTSFCVPQFHLTIVGAGKKLTTVIWEWDVFDCLNVTMKGSKTISMGVDIPKLEIQWVRWAQLTTKGLTLILVSIEPLIKRCPVSGKVRITEIPCVWPVQVCIQTFGMKQSCEPASCKRFGASATGGDMYVRPW